MLSKVLLSNVLQRSWKTPQVTAFSSYSSLGSSEDEVKILKDRTLEAETKSKILSGDEFQLCHAYEPKDLSKNRIIQSLIYSKSHAIDILSKAVAEGKAIKRKECMSQVNEQLKNLQYHMEHIEASGSVFCKVIRRMISPHIKNTEFSDIIGISLKPVDSSQSLLGHFAAAFDNSIVRKGPLVLIRRGHCEVTLGNLKTGNKTLSRRYYSTKETGGSVDSTANSENVKVIYKLPDVLQRIDDNQKLRIESLRDLLKGDLEGFRGQLKGDLEGIRGQLKGVDEGIRGQLKGEVEGLRGKIEGQNHKIIGYSTVGGLIFGVILKMIYDGIKGDFSKVSGGGFGHGNGEPSSQQQQIPK